MNKTKHAAKTSLASSRSTASTGKRAPARRPEHDERVAGHTEQYGHETNHIHTTLRLEGETDL